MKNLNHIQFYTFIQKILFKMEANDLTPNSLDYSGWLKKKGTNQGLWHKRFVYISQTSLFFFFLNLTLQSDC